MLSIVIFNKGKKGIEKNQIDSWLKETDDLIVIGKGSSEDNRLRYIEEFETLNDAELIEKLCDVVRNDYFLVCSPTARIDRSVARKNVLGGNIIMLKTVCVIPGKKRNLKSLETTVYGKIYSKTIVKSLKEKGVGVDKNLIFNILCDEEELKYIDDIFYYETDDGIFNYKMQIEDDDLFLRTVKKLPQERQAAVVNRWIISGKDRKERDRRIKEARLNKEWDRATQRFTVKKRLDNKFSRIRRKTFGKLTGRAVK